MRARSLSLVEPMPPAPARLVLLMGVAGSGKTTVGRAAAAALGWPYFEADDFHPATNRAKMAHGDPLDDADRAPWLAALRDRMDACRAAGASAVFSCSALKGAYRAYLQAPDAGGGARALVLVFLGLDAGTAAARVAARPGHFLPASLVESQFAALEPPRDALTLDARAPLDTLVARVVAAARATPPDLWCGLDAGR